MLRFEYPYSYDYRIPITPQLGVGVFFPSFHAPNNESIINDNQSSDSEQSTFDDFNNNNNDNFSNNNNDNNNNNNMIMNNNDNDNNNNNNDNNNESIHQESSLLSDSLPPTDSIPPPSVEFYVATPLFSPKTINAANDYLPPPSTISNNNHRNSISAVTSDDLSAFVMAGDGETNDSSSTSNNDNELVVNELPAVDLLPPPITGFAPLPVISPETIGSETDDEELFKKKKQKVSNNGAATTTKKTTGGRRGRKSAAAAATTAVDTSAAVPPPIPAPVPLSSDNPRKTSTGSDEDINDYSDSPNSSNPLSSSSDHYRTKHSISETRRRTRLRNQFKYLAEASTSAKTDRYSVLCAAIVKIEAAKRRIAELESQLAAATVGPTMGLSPLPPSSSGPSAMCCAESIEYGVCSQCSGVATALLSGDGVGTFLSANHRWLSLVGVHSLPELQSVAPSFLKVVGLSSAEISNARSTLSAVSAHKHGSMTLPLDSNTILAYKNHSDSSIEPALLYANIRYFPTKSSRPALLTLSSYEHGAADNRNPCVLVTAVPCEPLPEGVSISSYNDRLAHRGRKTIGNHHSNPSSSDSSSSSSSSSNAMIISNTGGTNKKEGKKRSYSQRVSSSRSNDRGEMAEDNNSNGFNARISNHFLKEEAF